MDENLGLVNPIGSMEKKIILDFQVFSRYLNEGSGSPWAGQVIAKLWPDDCLNPLKSTMDENLGLVNPIGSTEK